MSSKRKKIKQDINFTLEGVNGPVEYSLIPMTQKTAAHVFHTALSGILSALSGALSGKDESTKMASVLAHLKDALSFDDVWFILSNMMENAMVNDVEIGSLDDSDVFDENPHHMYLVLYHGIRGNWPHLFFQMEKALQGFVTKGGNNQATKEEDGTK